jgi:vacuolar-type H+-ATPase subunit E/Vma4
MSQNTLIEKIQYDAQAEVEKIQAESAQAVKVIASETETEIEALTTSHEANLAKEKQHLELVTLAKAKQSGKIAVQKAKREQIDAILNSARTALRDQVSAEYISFFASHVRQVVPQGATLQVVNAPQNRLDETKSILAEVGLTAEVEASSQIEAGLMLQAEDGVYDVTLNRLMEEKRPELEAMVVKQVIS